VAKRLDQILVIDVEATCWDGPIPEGEESEIIEIGVCTVDVASAERLERSSLIVRPAMSRVSEFCNRLTTLTQEQVEGGVAFADACSVLRRRFEARERLWASYGDYDRHQFERQCESQGVKYPFGPSHLNVKNLFAVVHALSPEIGMADALQRLGQPLEGVHHRGGDDAWNIAFILSHLLKQTRAGMLRN
jgi:inhibitor of KinA sporulation pathway (predicted exonuclease)